MAREDTRLYVAGAVFFASVLFLALPLAVMLVIDNEKRLAKMEQKIESRLPKSTQRSKDERNHIGVDQSPQSSEDDSRRD